MTRGARLLAEVFDRPKANAIAKRLKIHPSTLSLLSRGKRIPSMAMAMKLQKEFGIPVEAWTK